MDVTKSLMREYFKVSMDSLEYVSFEPEICDDACMGVFCSHNKIVVVVALGCVLTDDYICK